MNPIRAIRMRLMPVCSKCRWSNHDGYLCKREQCLEHFEKRECFKRDRLRSLEVRGRMFCKFERRNDEHDSD